MAKDLTQKQEKFCKEYVKCDNKSQAYRAAYDTSRMSKEVVNVKACELASTGKVSVRIAELKKITADIAEKEFKTDSTELLRHLTILRNSRIDDYVSFDKKAGDNLKMKFKPFSELTEEQLMCIESIKEGRNGIELKLHGKDWTIDKIAKHIGFYERDNKQSKSEINLPDMRGYTYEQLKKLAGGDK